MAASSAAEQGGQEPFGGSAHTDDGDLLLHTDSHHGSDVGGQVDFLGSWDTAAQPGLHVMPTASGQAQISQNPGCQQIQPGSLRGPGAPHGATPPAPQSHLHTQAPARRSSGGGSSHLAHGPAAALLATVPDSWLQASLDAARTATTSSDEHADLAQLDAPLDALHTEPHDPAEVNPGEAAVSPAPAAAGPSASPTAGPMSTAPSKLTPAPPDAAHVSGSSMQPAAMAAPHAAALHALQQQAAASTRTASITSLGSGPHAAAAQHKPQAPGRLSLDVPNLQKQVECAAAALAKLSPSGPKPPTPSSHAPSSATVMTVPASALNQFLGAGTSPVSPPATASQNAALAAALLHGSPVAGLAAGGSSLVSSPAVLSAVAAMSPGGGLAKQHALYKTEMCRGWLDSGTCRYGCKCQFAHGPEELRPVPRHPKYKTEVCRAFALTGTCAYGARCRFIHGTPPSASSLLGSAALNNITLASVLGSNMLQHGHASAPHATLIASPASNQGSASTAGNHAGTFPMGGAAAGGCAFTAGGMLEGISEMEGISEWAEDLVAGARASSTPSTFTMPAAAAPTTTAGRGPFNSTTGPFSSTADAARRLLDINSPPPKLPRRLADLARRASLGNAPSAPGTLAAAQQGASSAQSQQEQQAELLRRSLETLAAGGVGGSAPSYSPDLSLDPQQQLQALGAGGASGFSSGLLSNAELLQQLQNLQALRELQAAAAGMGMQLQGNEPSTSGPLGAGPSSNMQEDVGVWPGFLLNASQAPMEMGGMSTGSQNMRGGSGMDVSGVGSGVLPQMGSGGPSQASAAAQGSSADDAVVSWLMGGQRGSDAGRSLQLPRTSAPQMTAVPGRMSLDSARSAYENMQISAGMQQMMSGINWQALRVPSPEQQQQQQELTPSQLLLQAQQQLRQQQQHERDRTQSHQTVPPYPHYAMSRGSLDTQAAQRASYDGGLTNRAAYDTLGTVRMSFDGHALARAASQQHQAASQPLQLLLAQQQQAQQQLQPSQQAQQQQQPRMQQLQQAGRGSMDSSQARASFESARSTWENFAGGAAGEGPGAGVGRGAGGLSLDALKRLRESFWGLGANAPGSAGTGLPSVASDAGRVGGSSGMYSQQGDAAAGGRPRSSTPTTGSMGTGSGARLGAGAEMGRDTSSEYQSGNGSGGLWQQLQQSSGMGQAGGGGSGVGRTGSMPGAPGTSSAGGPGAGMAGASQQFAFPGFGNVMTQQQGQQQEQQDAGLAALLAALSSSRS